MTHAEIVAILSTQEYKDLALATAKTVLDKDMRPREEAAYIKEVFDAANDLPDDFPLYYFPRSVATEILYIQHPDCEQYQK